jgi:heat shock protein HslJ
MKKVILFLFFVLLLVNSCSTSNLVSQLAGTNWNVTSILGEALVSEDIAKGLPSLSFSDNGKLFGSTGCNNFTGDFKLDGTKLSLNPGAITKMMCPSDTEQNFLNAIKQVTSIKMIGDKLELLSGAQTVMSLVSKTK